MISKKYASVANLPEGFSFDEHGTVNKEKF